MSTPVSKLHNLCACHDSRKWAQAYPDLEAAWLQCPRGDWLLWYAGAVGVKREALVLAACECARLALPFAKGDEARVAIETAEAWARGEVALEQVRIAANAACAASAAARAAIYAVNYVVNYAADGAGYARPDKVLAQCADIVRRFFPVLPEGGAE